jgi:hypothetical protein
VVLGEMGQRYIHKGRKKILPKGTEQTREGGGGRKLQGPFILKEIYEDYLKIYFHIQLLFNYYKESCFVKAHPYK